jgi:hypothetical protein
MEPQKRFREEAIMVRSTTSYRSLGRQRGLSFWSVGINLLILTLLLTILTRAVPIYIEYLTVRDIVHRAAEEFDSRSQTTQDLKTRIRKLMQTSQVYGPANEAVKVYRENGQYYIDATYEVRFPLIWILDGVMVFDDLLIQVDR